MTASHEKTSQVRASLVEWAWEPRSFRAALLDVPPTERDAWVDRELGIEDIPDDGPHLPRGCVPYLPCSVASILETIELAGIDDADVFVDVGCGLGRAGLLVQLLTGASVIGLEVQPSLAQAAIDLIAFHGVEHFSIVVGDAVELASHISDGSVFFLYCPFSGTRLERFVDTLAPLSKRRTLRICSVALPLPHRPWLHAERTQTPGVAMSRTRLHS